MIRIHIRMKLLASVILTAVTAFAQSSDRLPVTDTDRSRHTTRRSHIHHQERDCARLAIGAWRRIPATSQRIERMDLSSGYSWLSAR